MEILTDSGPALTSVSVVPGILMLPSVCYAGRSYQKILLNLIKKKQILTFKKLDKKHFSHSVLSQYSNDVFGFGIHI